MLMVLVQNEDKSYNFLPKLIIGSFLTSFVFVILWQLIEYDYDSHFILLGALQMVLFFSIVCIFGGLIGIVIRGITLLIKKYAKN
jgi:H+/Cl- antiporter ClcA